MPTTVELPAGTWSADSVLSTFGFEVKYNFGTFRSKFTDVSATLADGVLTGSARVESIDIDVPQFKQHVLGEDFFDAENSPEITFKTQSITPSDDGTVSVTGDLTIRGTTKSVTATGNVESGTDGFGQERVSFELRTTVDRREFGLNWQNPLPNGKESLAWDVTIVVDLLLVKEA